MCRESGCPRKVHAHGLCHRHYTRALRCGVIVAKKAPATLADALWSKVARRGPRECWLWTGATQRHGYGHFRRQGRDYTASRVAWELTNGPVPDGLYVLHRCDNPPCCNPGHLFLGTQAVNMADMTEKGRRRAFAHRGERHYRARLTERDVVDIRRARAVGVTLRQLAPAYGVCAATISHAATGRNWSHLCV